MKKIIYLLSIICIAGLAPGVRARNGDETKPSIAVVPCRIGGAVTITEGSFISERITLEIIKQGRYAVIDKYEIQKKLRLAVEFRDTCPAVSCYFALGRQCQADFVLWAALSHKETATTLELHYGTAVENRVLNTVSTSMAGSTLDVADQLPALLAELFNMSITAAASGAAQTAPANAAPKIVYTPRKTPVFRSLTARSEPAGAAVTLNGEAIGVTPCAKDSLPAGTYDITFDLYGYKKFSTQITITPDADKKVFAKLESAFGSLTVLTSPSAAVCSLAVGLRATTPFSCDTLRPATYTIKISLDKYASVTKTVSIAAGQRDTVVQTLISLRVLDSLKQAHRKKVQNVRKIVFGAGALCCFGLGLAAESAAHQSLENQRNAYDAYVKMNGDNTLAQFDAQWAEYQNYKSETDKNLFRRNTWYGIGLACLAAMTISFRF